MTNTSRRNMLAASVTGLFGAALSPFQPAEGNELSRDELVPSVANSTLSKIVDELHQFRIDVLKAMAQEQEKAEHPETIQLGPPGVSVPFATTPINFYARTPMWLRGKVTPPNMDWLLDGDWSKEVEQKAQLVTRGLWDKLAPPCWKQVKRCTTKSPYHDRVMSDRIVTPRYSLDLESPDCDALALALLLTNMPYDLVNEINAKIVSAMNICVESEKFDINRAAGYLEYVPVQVYVKKEAYMLEVFAWTTSNGFLVDSGRQPGWAVNIPIGTLPLKTFNKQGLLRERPTVQ